MIVNIITRSEHPPQNIQIVRSDYAQRDANKQYSTLVCEVEKLHWNPKKVLEEYVNTHNEFFREDLILVTLFTKNTNYTYIRMSDSSYVHYRPHTKSNEDLGAYEIDGHVPLERDSYDRVNKKARNRSLLIFLVIVVVFLMILYRGM